MLVPHLSYSAAALLSFSSTTLTQFNDVVRQMKYNPGALCIQRNSINNWKKGYSSLFLRQRTVLCVGGVTVLGYTVFSLVYHFWFYSN